MTLHFTNSAAQRTMRGLVGSLDLSPFRLYLPTTEEYIGGFNGYVSAWNQTTEANAPMTADVSIRISGAITDEAATSPTGSAPPSFASTDVTFDSTDYTFDETT